MMISILHKLLSTGMVAAKGGMEEVLLEVREASKACMVNHIKGMGRPPRRAMISIQRPLQMPSHSSTHPLVGTALLPEISATMRVLGRHNHPKILSSIPALVLAITVTCLTSLAVLSRISQGKTRGLGLT